MSSAQVKCPSCGVLLKLTTLPPAGRAIKCPKCGKAFRLAAPAPAAPPPAAARQPDKAAPAPPRPKPAAQRAEDEEVVSERPMKGRPIVDDNDEPVVKPPRKRPVVDEDDDEGDDRPAKRLVHAAGGCHPGEARGGDAEVHGKAPAAGIRRGAPNYLSRRVPKTCV